MGAVSGPDLRFVDGWREWITGAPQRRPTVSTPSGQSANPNGADEGTQTPAARETPHRPATRRHSQWAGLAAGGCAGAATFITTLRTAGFSLGKIG
eukprot:CAMPEP_0206328462 /NCGR_PEP_ID=MMETSP0106_2-20121207/22692_1 /ASSEMBLY_ACC=CAM_ASM_000206 /TAXON_ID=81532 /ORGANISM="Acanthoeca-like sp., Strain 10tr" /LENGTH=95 /DNA_ID=CAMNT_0053761143 /DNA_START=204 /DNA_END=488 /DNA_ORIENTATION=+